jgi:hypothetical protein
MQTISLAQPRRDVAADHACCSRFHRARAAKVEETVRGLERLERVDS